MGEIVRRLPPVRTFFRDTFFRNSRTFPTKSVDVDYVKGNRAVAPFVHPKVGGKTVFRDGYQTKSYTPPLVAPDTITTLDDLLERMPGENPYSGRTPADRAVEMLRDDFARMLESITRREELMCAQSIFNGAVPIIGEGLDEVIDFGFTNNVTITDPAATWDSSTATPLDDLDDWNEILQQRGFVNGDIAICGKKVAHCLVNNPQVKSLLDIKNYQIARIEPRNLPSGYTYLGTYKGSLDIYTGNEWYLDDWTDPENPVELPLIPVGKLALMSTAARYSMYYGAVSILNDAGQWNTVEGNRVPNTWVEHRPDRRFLQLSSRPLPVPHEVDSWLVATVL
jgi:hypothetical protein